MTPIEKTAAPTRCTSVSITGTNQITWKFEDGTEVVTDHDLSTDRGRLLFAQEAEKLGFGSRRDIARLVSAPIGQFDDPSGQGPRAILQRS